MHLKCCFFYFLFNYYFTVININCGHLVSLYSTISCIEDKLTLFKCEFLLLSFVFFAGFMLQSFTIAITAILHVYQSVLLSWLYTDCDNKIISIILCYVYYVALTMITANILQIWNYNKKYN